VKKRVFHLVVYHQVMKNFKTCFGIDGNVTVLADEHSDVGTMMKDVSAGEGIHILTTMIK